MNSEDTEYTDTLTFEPHPEDLTPSDVRTALRDLGYSPVPCQGKNPNREGWQKNLVVTDAMLLAWSRDKLLSNTGAITKVTPTLDIDIMNPEAADAVEALVRNQYEDPGRILVRFGMPPKRAIPFRTAAPFAKIVVNLIAPNGKPEKIEMLGDGQHFVVHGIHPDTQKPYHWFGDAPWQVSRDKLPLIDEAAAQQLVEDAVGLLCRDFGYQRFKGKGNGACGDDDSEGTEWATLIENIRGGHLLHDSLRDLAAACITSGMSSGAAVNFLRKLMDSSECEHDEERWKPRYDDIPRLVQSAEKKKQESVSDEQQMLDDLNKTYCVVPIQGKLRVLTFDEEAGRHIPVFMASADFKALLDNKKITRGRKRIGLGSWWFDHNDREQRSGVCFKPMQGRVVNGKRNLWIDFGIKPAPGQWPLIKAHIHEVLAADDQTSASYITRWTAWTLQNPGSPAEVAVVFRGRPGTGKGLYGRMMKRIFGQHGHHISSADHLTGKFNRHLMDCALLFADEAFAPRDKSAVSTFRRLITEPTLFVEPKGLDSFEVDNVIHLIMAANAQWVVPAGIDERRVAMFDVSDKYAQSKAYFKPLYAEMESGGIAAMMHDLLALDLDGWHPREEVPRTDALHDQIMRNLSPGDQFWSELLHGGVLPDDDIDSGHDCAGNNNARRVSSDNIFAVMREKVPQLKFSSEHTLGRILRGHGCAKELPEAPELRNRRGRRTWLLPSLKTAREAWSKKLPQVVWDEEEQMEWKREPM